jgi:hypothetical protein
MKNWRFCHKCFAMFYDGNPRKGRCPTGDGHEAQGLNFNLPHGIAETARDQAQWRYCRKCVSMFFDGFETQGACPGGGGHEAGSEHNFVLRHDVLEDFPLTQAAWRFCGRCFELFFDGFDEKGSCPAGGSHEATGFDFVLRTTEQRIDDNP